MKLVTLRKICSLMALGACVSACSNDAAAPADDLDAYPSHRQEFFGTGRTLGFVANRYSDTVSVIDLDAMSVLGTAPVGRDPVDIDGPRHIVLDPAARLAYVALSYPLAVESPHVVENGGGVRAGYVQALSLRDLSVQGELILEHNPSELELSADAGELAISHYDTYLSLKGSTLEERRATVAFVAPPSALSGDSPSARSLPVCVTPSAMAYGPDRSRLFVACTGEDSLAVVDPASLSVVARVKAGELASNKPFSLVADALRERLVLSNQVARTAVVFGMQDAPEILATAQLSGVPFFAAWTSSSEFVVPTQGVSGAVRVDAASGTILKEARYDVTECENASEVHPLPDGRLLIVCEGDHYEPGTLVEIDPETLEIQTVLVLGLYPDRMAVLLP